jgi:hypothetical protein
MSERSRLRSRFLLQEPAGRRWGRWTPPKVEDGGGGARFLLQEPAGRRWGRWTPPKVEDGGGGAHQRNPATDLQLLAERARRQDVPSPRERSECWGRCHGVTEGVFSLQALAERTQRTCPC